MRTRTVAEAEGSEATAMGPPLACKKDLASHNDYALHDALFSTIECGMVVLPPGGGRMDRSGPAIVFGPACAELSLQSEGAETRLI